MTDKERMSKIIKALEIEYPQADCALEYQGDPWKLLIMARLSAQCTDIRVNAVSKELFRKIPDAAAMADADTEYIESIIRPCGLHKTKALSIKGMSQKLVSEYGGIIPPAMEDLLSFPGVGRKIANLIRGDLYNLGGIVADTHCIRIAGRLGFCAEGEKNALKVERALDPLVPAHEQSDFCHRIVLHGRKTCSARSPKCGECNLSEWCAHYSPDKRR